MTLRLRTSARKRPWTIFALFAGAALVITQVLGIVPALANAANPNPDTAATATVNPDGR
jgi:hypothetical protein